MGRKRKLRPGDEWNVWVQRHDAAGLIQVGMVGRRGGDQWGFLGLTPDEARRLAAMLTEEAAKVAVKSR